MISTIQKEIQIDAWPMVVFGAITDPDKIIRYYPVEAVRSDSHVDGEIIFEGKPVSSLLPITASSKYLTALASSGIAIGAITMERRSFQKTI